MARVSASQSPRSRGDEAGAPLGAGFWRWTGVFGLGVVAITWAEFPLWVIGGSSPAYNGAAYAENLFHHSTIAFTRILMDLGIYVAAMIFAARLSHLIRLARPGFDWAATLVFGSAAVWFGVTLVADGLEGGATLDTLRGNADPSAVRALIDGTLLIFNGSIAFVLTGLFLAAAGYATFATGVLPRWTGWLAYITAALCAISIPAMYAGPVDYTGFYNAGGWGPAIIASFPPLIWFLVVGTVMVRKRESSEVSRNRGRVQSPQEAASAPRPHAG
jgi:hypothetical protein